VESITGPLKSLKIPFLNTPDKWNKEFSAKSIEGTGGTGQVFFAIPDLKDSLMM
jgi:hypothetical protein